MNKYNRLIRLSDFDDPDFVACIKATLACPLELHHKHWEWGMGFKLLRDLGFLSRDKVALGLGCGAEAYPFVLSKYLGKSIRTDYLGDDNKFKTKLQSWHGPIREYAPKCEYEKERVSFMDLDATKMSCIESNSIDIIYSFSSIEHFGLRDRGIHGAVKCMRESQRVLKIGGVCLGTTEFQLDSNSHPEFFRKEDFQREMIDSHSMKPVEPFDFTIPKEICRSEYMLPTMLRSFPLIKKYRPELGAVAGPCVIVPIFFAFIKTEDAAPDPKRKMPAALALKEMISLHVCKTWESLPGRGFGRIAIFGGGRHTEWLLDTVKNSKGPEVACILDDAPKAAKMKGIPLLQASKLDKKELLPILLSTDVYQKDFSRRCRELYGDQAKTIDIYAEIPFMGPYLKDQ